MSRAEEIIARYHQYVMATYTPELVLVKGKGTRVWDADGKVYLDFLCGLSVTGTGHCHPRVVQAIQEQAARLVHVSNLYYSEPQVRLAERLSRLALGGKCFFSNSGAEANEGLIKLARLWGHDEGRYEIITMRNSFHGRTLATASATGQDKVKKGFEPMPEGFVHATFNDIDSVRACVTDKTVAVMLEAVQGEGGVVPAETEFMQAVRMLCDEKNLLMLCDEVQCGMGRTGKWFGYEHSGVDPDAISLAKSLGSGYPIGAVVSGAKLGDVFRPGKHASTFGGTPLACAAALATVEVIEEEDLVQKAAVNGKRFMQGLQGLADKYDRVSGVRGKGLMVGLVLDREALPMQKLLVDMGLLCLATAGNVLRFLPPLNVKESEIDDAVDMIDECLEAWHEGEVVEPAPETETAAEDAPAAEPGSDEADETDGDEGDAGNEADTTEARE